MPKGSSRQNVNKHHGGGKEVREEGFATLTPITLAEDGTSNTYSKRLGRKLDSEVFNVNVRDSVDHAHIMQFGEVCMGLDERTGLQERSAFGSAEKTRSSVRRLDC
jgi:hypothetical protein